MSKKVAIIISPNWRDYAEKYLAECLESLRRQDFPGEFKIFLVDNESSEESMALLKKIVETHGMRLDESGKNNPPYLQNPPTPLFERGQGGQIEIIRNKNNDGFAKGNNDAIKLALAQGFDYVILFNMDTVIEKNCVSELVKVAENPPNPLYQGGGKNPPNPPLSRGAIGAVQARLMLHPETEKINSLGNITHFLGFGYCLGYRQQMSDVGCRISDFGCRISDVGFRMSDICYPSGAAVLFKAEVLKKVGLFDEEFWMYNEDQDLGWRIWLAGYKCVLAPEAVVYHKYEFAKSIQQYYWMDRNRMLSIIKNYHWLTLVLITPACLVMELGLLLFSLKTGWFKEKIKVWLYFLKPRTWKYLKKSRRKSQSLRQVKDRDIVKMFTGKIWYQEIDDPKLRLVNPIFDWYWRIVRKIIIW